MQKFDVDKVFKSLGLCLASALKTIITYGTLAYISLSLTFGGKSFYSNVSLLVELIADLINKAFPTGYLKGLSKL